ncbi:MAG: hypothetical protein AAF762_07080 [Pseudomonadota bacterium]
MTFTEGARAAKIINTALRMFRDSALEIMVGTPEHSDHLFLHSDCDLFTSSEALLTAEGEVCGAVETVNEAISANCGLTFTFGAESFAMRFAVEQ